MQFFSIKVSSIYPTIGTPSGVYDKQALVLVHYGGGKGKDIVELAYKIQNSVEEKFGIKISPEVNFV